MIRRGALVLTLALAAPAWGFEPDLPSGARMVTENDTPSARYDLPVSAWQDGGVETLPLTGDVRRSIWHLEGGDSTQQVLASLTEQLRGLGYAPVFECVDRGCGGFDFRFAIDVAPAPDMYVNLGDFGFAAAMDAAGNAVSLLASSGRTAVFLQIVTVERATRDVPTDLGRALSESGRVVLDGLAFEPGGVLDPAPMPGLAALAGYLASYPETRIAIVAHSDVPADGDVTRAEGLAEARAVRARLIAEYGVDPSRIEALWLGPFTPRATPLTETGRTLNRRIEAVLLPN